MPEKLDLQRQYTAKDFAALRAFVQRLPPAVIARTYFSQDDDPHAAMPGAMERYLRDMLATLVALAIEHGSPVLADHLKASIRKHGSARLTAASLKMVEDAARLAVSRPAAGHGIGMWFRPMVARYLKRRGVRRRTRGVLQRPGRQLVALVPRVGPGRASAVVAGCAAINRRSACAWRRTSISPTRWWPRMPQSSRWVDRPGCSRRSSASHFARSSTAPQA
jgi:GNAT superfamily N-acetyltransferase